MIYSYRDSVNSEIPEFTSKNARNALYKILEIRNEISSSNSNNYMIQHDIFREKKN